MAKRKARIVASLSIVVTAAIEEMLCKGYEFMLYYGRPNPSKDKNPVWEADFTKRKKNGLWDNHKTGTHKFDAGLAVIKALVNHKKGLRLKKKGS